MADSDSVYVGKSMTAMYHNVPHLTPANMALTTISRMRFPFCAGGCILQAALRLGLSLYKARNSVC